MEMSLVGTPSVHMILENGAKGAGKYKPHHHKPTSQTSYVNDSNLYVNYIRDMMNEILIAIMWRCLFLVIALLFYRSRMYLFVFLPFKVMAISNAECSVGTVIHKCTVFGSTYACICAYVLMYCVSSCFSY